MYARGVRERPVTFFYRPARKLALAGGLQSCRGETPPAPVRRRRLCTPSIVGPAHVTRQPASNPGAAVTDNKLSSHILPTSSTMVGVCMTAVTLVKLGETTTMLTRVDELMAFDGLLFLVSAFLSYMAIRTTTRLAIGLERMADAVFMLGLCLTVVASFLLAYSIL
jgi:hypothetical protein